MTTTPVRTRRWTRKEDDRLVELGVLREDEAIESIPAPAAGFGWRHAEVRLLRAGATIAPLARPDAAIAVADLLP